MVVAARLERRVGPDVLGPELGIAPRTVTRILRRHQIPVLACCDPMTGQVIRASKHTTVRYEKARPGELIPDWAYRRVYTNNDERTAALEPWLIDDNAHRRHSALGGQPPASRLLSPT